MTEANGFFGLAAVGTLIAALWKQIQQWMMGLTGLAICRTGIEGKANEYMREWLWKNAKPSLSRFRQYFSYLAYVRPQKNVGTIILESPIKTTIFWVGWLPVFVTLEEDNLYLSYLRGTIDIEKIFESFCEVSLRGDKLRFQVSILKGVGCRSDRELKISEAKMHMPPFAGNEKPTEAVVAAGHRKAGSTFEEIKRKFRIIRWNPDEIGSAVCVLQSAMSTLFFPPSVMELATEMQQWLKGKEWYQSKGIPWRRGWQLNGPPGTGKTSLVRALSQDYDLPIYALDIASMNNKELTDHWMTMRNQTPCVVLIEDLDNVFVGRENILGEGGGGLSFDCLLNCMSGIETCDGMFIVVTTNHPEKIDPALGISQEGHGTISTRPGRLDRVLHLSHMDRDCRQRMAEFILDRFPDHIDDIVAEGSGDTPAQFQFRCAQLADQLFWKEAQPQTELRLTGTD